MTDSVQIVYLLCYGQSQQLRVDSVIETHDVMR